MPHIAVLITCFNRREQTLACLRALFSQEKARLRSMQVILVDDGCTDGTADAVRAAFPAVRILQGSGHLFWNGGMRLAFSEASKTHFDYLLWLNDDTLLYPSALDSLLATAAELEAQGKWAIVTGSTLDAGTGRRSYGGEQLVRRRLTRTTIPIEPLPDQYQLCDTMHGNCTLVPKKIADILGNFEARFTHSFGDMDYGFRARAAGFTIVLVAGFVGLCSDNSRAGTWRDRSASLSRRWRNLNSIKGSPFPEWLLYCRRHQGPLWPLYAVSPYLKTLATGVLRLR